MDGPKRTKDFGQDDKVIRIIIRLSFFFIFKQNNQFKIRKYKNEKINS